MNPVSLGDPTLDISGGGDFIYIDYGRGGAMVWGGSEGSGTMTMS